MADKKIRFSGVDSGLSNQFSSLRESSRRLSSELEKDSDSQITATKKRVREIEAEIETLQKRNREARQGVSQPSMSGEGKGQKSIFSEVREKASGEGNSDSNEEYEKGEERESQIQYLHEILEQLKDINQGESGLEGRQSGFQGGGNQGPPSGGFTNRGGENSGSGGRRSFFDASNRAGSSAQGLLSNPALAFASIPIVGGIAAYVMSQFDRREQAGLGYTGTTGENLEVSDLASTYGFDKSEVLQSAEKLAESRGYGEDAATDALRQLSASRALDIDQDVLNNLSSLTTLDRSNLSSTGQVSEFIRLGRGAGMFQNNDFSKLETLLEESNELTLQQTERVENINSKSNRDLFIALNEVGGSFGNLKTVGGRVSSLDQSLANPSNEFRQAESYGILRQINPDASLTELMEMQQGGVSTPGYLSGILSNLRENFSREEGILRLAPLLNDNIGAARKLLSRYDEDPEIRERIENIGSDSQFSSMSDDLNLGKGVFEGASTFESRTQNIAPALNELNTTLSNLSGDMGEELRPLLVEFSSSIQKFSSIVKNFNKIQPK